MGKEPEEQFDYICVVKSGKINEKSWIDDERNVDFFDIKDSNAWAIASKPAEALIWFGAEIGKSGTKKKLSGINNSLSNECLILST